MHREFKLTSEGGVENFLADVILVVPGFLRPTLDNELYGEALFFLIAHVQDPAVASTVAGIFGISPRRVSTLSRIPVYDLLGSAPAGGLENAAPMVLHRVAGWVGPEPRVD